VQIKSCNFILSGFLGTKEFVILAFILLAVFTIAYFKFIKRSLVGDIGLGLLVIGALVNLLERYFLGCVNDYINFFGLFHCNLADLLVSAGIILILIIIWKAK